MPPRQCYTSDLRTLSVRKGGRGVAQLSAERIGNQQEEFIGTVDAWALDQLHWPFLRVFARDFVETRELCQYERKLLASGRWIRVRCCPHPVAGVSTTAHLFDFYGVPAAGAASWRSS
jgi:hypothetical protein